MDWIQWEPKGLYSGPIADYVWVEVMMLDGETDQSFSGDFDWGVKDEPGEIIAYRFPVLHDAEKTKVMELQDE